MRGTTYSELTGQGGLYSCQLGVDEERDAVQDEADSCLFQLTN